MLHVACAAVHCACCDAAVLCCAVLCPAACAVLCCAQVPLINVLLPFVWKSFPFIFTADVAAVVGVYAWKVRQLRHWQCVDTLLTQFSSESPASRVCQYGFAMYAMHRGATLCA
jgi:hypothetical protein